MRKWSNVFQGQPENTFQAVIAMDNKFRKSFVMFRYHNLEWQGNVLNAAGLKVRLSSKRPKTLIIYNHSKYFDIVTLHLLQIGTVVSSLPFSGTSLMFGMHLIRSNIGPLNMSMS